MAIRKCRPSIVRNSQPFKITITCSDDGAMWPTLSFSVDVSPLDGKISRTPLRCKGYESSRAWEVGLPPLCDTNNSPRRQGAHLWCSQGATLYSIVRGGKYFEMGLMGGVPCHHLTVHMNTPTFSPCPALILFFHRPRRVPQAFANKSCHRSKIGMPHVGAMAAAKSSTGGGAATRMTVSPAVEASRGNSASSSATIASAAVGSTVNGRTAPRTAGAVAVAGGRDLEAAGTTVTSYPAAKGVASGTRAAGRRKLKSTMIESQGPARRMKSERSVGAAGDSVHEDGHIGKRRRRKVYTYIAVQSVYNSSVRWIREVCRTYCMTCCVLRKDSLQFCGWTIFAKSGAKAVDSCPCYEKVSGVTNANLRLTAVFGRHGGSSW